MKTRLLTTVTRCAFLALAAILAGQATESAPAKIAGAAAARGSVTGRILDRETGQYLNNARVSVRGTPLAAFTDQTGTYRLTKLPAGPIVVTVFYTGLEPQQAAVDVLAGQNVERDFDLAIAGGIVRLEKFTVRGARDLETISINEQRFAPNIKLVAAPRDHQAAADGNIGEFMKSLPGVSPEYWDDEVMAISVRGFGSEFVGLTLDGAAIAGAHRNGSFRSFQTPNLAMNNISRVEITHVPTPSTPADSLGGSVNLVSKSAFERNGARIEYSAFFSANQHAMTLRKSPDMSDRAIYQILPGFTFDYTLPVNRSFGLVLSVNRSQVFTQQNYLDKNYVTSGPGTGASISKPFLRRTTVGYGPKTTTQNGGSLKADWRMTPNIVVSFSLQGTDYDTIWSFGNWGADAGANGTPAPANGAPMTFGADFTHGATGRGTLRMSNSGSNRKNSSMGEHIRFRFDNRTWRAEAGITASVAKAPAFQSDRGYFNGASISTVNPLRVNLDGIAVGSGPSDIQVFNNSSQPVDPANIQNYQLTTVSSSPRMTEASVRGVDASLRRQVDTLAFSAALQFGGGQNIRTNDARYWNDTYTYNGPPGSLAPYLSIMAHRPLAGNFPDLFNNIPWISVRKLHAAWQRDPRLFTQTPAQLVAAERFRITTSEWIRETVNAAYVQGEARLFHNRLNLVTGVRWEQTKDAGLGPLVDPSAAFLHLANGAFARDAQGRQIRRPEAGAAGSMDELRLTTRERAYRGARAYDGYFPSLNAAYHVTDNFQIRFGWAKTYGRPDFRFIIPNATISQANLDQLQFLDPAQIRGTINVRNTALEPWHADNYDLSFEHYSDQGGLATLSVFTKTVKGLFGEIVKAATPEDLATLGLDPAYVGWRLTTQTNTDRARIAGLSLNLKQSLRALGRIGRYFSVFGNLTQLQLEGRPETDFSNFIRSRANWGFNFTRQNIDLSATWNHVGLQNDSAENSFGPDAYYRFAANTLVDANVEYRLKKQLVFFVSARNLFNQPRRELIYGSDTPAYARQYLLREYGTRYTAGIKGMF